MNRTPPSPAPPAEPTSGGSQADTSAATERPLAPLLELRDGLPPVIGTDAGLAEVAEAIAAGSGPIAVDAERASGYRYSPRAYLIQLRREGVGTSLIDPIGIADLTPLATVLADIEWIVHAATQDLPCLAEVGLRPTLLFDTELAGRLLGYPRVGLATLTELLLGKRMRKEHSAVDWSTRPLPESWLTYAALDVEVLIELRALLHDELVAAGKWEWARQEFEALVGFEPAVRLDPWRRTTGLHKVRGRLGLGAVRALWLERDSIARERDISPGRLLPDSAIVAAVLNSSTERSDGQPVSRSALLATKGFHGRGAERYAHRWLAALNGVAAIAPDDLPQRVPAIEGPPVPRAWADKDPIAARRLALGREALVDLAADLALPTENLLLPDHLRRLMWTPPEAPDPTDSESRGADDLAPAVAARLAGLGARPWQVELTAHRLAGVIVKARDDAEQAARTDEITATHSHRPRFPD
ncbi:MAG: HRDC domain-containing protein [Nocardioides sp.]